MSMRNIELEFYGGDLRDKPKGFWLHLEGVWIAYLCCKEHCTQQWQTHLNKNKNSQEKWEGKRTSMLQVSERIFIVGRIASETSAEFIWCAAFCLIFSNTLCYAFLYPKLLKGKSTDYTYLNFILFYSWFYLKKRELNILQVLCISNNIFISDLIETKWSDESD